MIALLNERWEAWPRQYSRGRCIASNELFKKTKTKLKISKLRIQFKKLSIVKFKSKEGNFCLIKNINIAHS